METIGPSIDRLPRRTAQTYALVATTWIIGSDLVLSIIGDTTRNDFAANAGKGLAFVAVTTAGLWFVLHLWAQRELGAWDAVRREQMRFEALVEGAGDMIGILDDDGRVTYVSPSLERTLGWEAGDMVGAQGRVFVHPDDVASAIALLTAIRNEDDAQPPQTIRMLTPEGRWRHVEILGTDLRHEPSVGGVVVHGRDVTDRHIAESRLEHALTHDAITGLPNRVQFDDDVRDAALGAEARGLHLLVLVVDILAFRDVNAALGRNGGDEILRMIATRINDQPEATAVGRLGADEFGVTFPIAPAEPSAVAEATDIAVKLSDALSAPFSVDDRRFHLSAHVGGALVRLPGPVDRSLVQAETNLRDAKRHPDRVVITEPSLHAHPGRGASMLAGALHDAVGSGQLVLHYQPQYDLGTGAVVGAEALLRWHHPTDGLLAPRSFLAEATRGALLPIVTRFVLTAATTQAAAWARAGHPIVVSANLSLGDLRRQSIVDEVVAAVAESRLDPPLLCLELTEQTLLAEPERSLKAIQSLRAEGIQFSIDDFGTGYSSLVHLRTLPVDELKIDRVFIAGMTAGGVDDAIVGAILDMGHRTGLTIVAEGIENIETYEALTARACDHGQGYLMSRPVAAEDVTFEPFRVSSR